MDSVIDPAAQLDELRRRTEEHPNSASAHFNLGLAFCGRGLVDRAEKAYRRALALNPDLVEAWVNLGGVLLLKWDFRGCLAANTEAIRRREDLIEAHFNAGQACLYLRDGEGLVRAARRVVELAPAHAAGQYFLAVGLLAGGQVHEARAALSKAMALGYRPPPDFLRALVRAEGEPTKAETTADRVILEPEGT